MDKIWNITIDFLAKINTWIPLVSILWAGAGLVGIVLILAITGCALRKRLVPQWLIWGYFIFAAIIIFAQANNDIFTVVAYMEIPFLIVLVCYFLRMLFYRRPRYTYVERTVQVREVSKKPAAKNVNKEVAVVSQIQTSVLDEEDDEDDNQVNIDETIAEVKAEASEENTIAEVVADKAEVEEESVVDSVIENVDTEEAKEANVAEVETASNVEAEEEIIAEPVKVAEPVTTDLPVVEPIVEKTYEAPRPTMTTNTATTAATAARPTTATSTFGRTSLGTGSLFGSRPTSSTSTTTTTTTPRSTLNTKTTATTARPTLSSYSSMLGARKPAATSATSTTSTMRSTSSVGTSTTAKPRSTDDIMAAIERLRASMKKN